MRTTMWMVAAVAVLFATQSHAQENPWRSPGAGTSMVLPYEYPSIIDYSPRMTFEPYQPYNGQSGWMEDFGRTAFQPSPVVAPEPNYHETFMKEMRAQQREQSRFIMKSWRETAPQRRRNGLAVCAKYNVGCAKELWGMGD